jgi:hypothetical protein
MTDRVPFRLAVTGSVEFTDAALIDRYMYALLRLKIRTHAVTLVCADDGPGRLAARWATGAGIAVEAMPDPSPRDANGTFRNSAVLRDCSAFVAFRAVEGWPEAVEDLVTRARVAGLKVRVVEG